MEAEILFILLLALIILGPRRLPEIGRQLGKAMAELRRAKYEFTRQIEEEVRRIEEEEAEANAQKALAASTESTAQENKILPPASAPAGTVNVGASSATASSLSNNA